ncbi:hypothetical protein TW81_08735 [Vibrio galatheae]|uniref:Lipoprotein n=1 Tax=Vibrio galatheae TaxID=579748 RepID=A0A0F4NJL2_9VIBR|nr:hypothetical protein [Vibrio galatheae]KJY83089.1 hypothetical protein TW81_08735 [Vibrio galatheae]
MKRTIVIALAVFLAACASSPYQYYVKPTPIKKQQTVYKVDEINVNLTLGHGAIPGDNSFAGKSELQKQFKKYLESSLLEKGLLAQNEQDALDVSVTVDYKRNFNHGGKALNKPEVSHSVTIHNEKEKLAGFSKAGYTTKYAYFDEIAVNLEISTFNWDQEDEPRDIELISKQIVDDIVNAGS